MAKIKVILEPGETELDADIALHKALEYHSSGDVHDGEAFDDPAMIHMAQRMDEIHTKIYNEMVREIIEELDKEYSDGRV